MNSDSKYMERAIRLAEKGAGWVTPNPLVGAVIVKNGTIIGEGFHEFYGGPHAEVNALQACTEDPAGATLYVTLEPCAHQGHTPPCAPLIVSRNLEKVVVGMNDPNPLVNGRGIDLLRSSGLTVETGLLEEKIRLQNEVFIKYITTGEPFVVLKTAMTLDGKTATVTGESKWITGEASRKEVHRMRQRYSAVMTGIGTVLADNPMLNIRRRSAQKHHPLKVVVDSSLKISNDAGIIANDPQLALIAVTGKAPGGRITEIERTGAQVLVCPEKDGGVDLRFLMHALGLMGVDSVMIEGGSHLAFSALREGVVDKVISFIAPKLLGGDHAFTPVGGSGIERLSEAILLEEIRIRRSGCDVLLEGRIKK